MGMLYQQAVHQLQALIDQVEEPALRSTFQSIHQGYPADTLVRFLKAREWNVDKAYEMLLDCLKWRVQNEIDNIQSKPIVPVELYRAVRDSQLIGLSGYSREGLPVFAIGVGLSTFNKASVHYYVQSHIQVNEYRDRIILPSATQRYGRHIGTCIKILDMTGLKLSALSHIKPLPEADKWMFQKLEHIAIKLLHSRALLTIISSIDDLNYPEKTHTYYIVNAPYVFSACWKVVKPLLQERTRRKVQVLPGCGRDELLKIMDYDSLPHFCKKEASGSSRQPEKEINNCYSLDHPFHQKLYSYIKQQSLHQEHTQPVKQGSFHVDLPEPPAEEAEIARSIESELQKLGDQIGISDSTDGSDGNND